MVGCVSHLPLHETLRIKHQCNREQALSVLKRGCTEVKVHLPAKVRSDPERVGNRYHGLLAILSRVETLGHIKEVDPLYLCAFFRSGLDRQAATKREIH